MSNLQAIYYYSAILVFIGTLRSRKITLSSPLMEHIVLITQTLAAPLVLIMSCLFNSTDFKE